MKEQPSVDNWRDTPNILWELKENTVHLWGKASFKLKIFSTYLFFKENNIFYYTYQSKF